MSKVVMIETDVELPSEEVLVRIRKSGKRNYVGVFGAREKPFPGNFKEAVQTFHRDASVPSWGRRCMYIGVTYYPTEVFLNGEVMALKKGKLYLADCYVPHRTPSNIPVGERFFFRNHLTYPLQEEILALPSEKIVKVFREENPEKLVACETCHGFDSLGTHFNCSRANTGIMARTLEEVLKK